MIDLETALKNHDWSLDGYKTRPDLDRLMKENTNGGYIAWSRR